MLPLERECLRMTGGRDIPLVNTAFRETACRTFLTTVNAALLAPPPVILRNYPSNRATEPIGHEWTFLEAARATSAAQYVFAPLRVGSASFIDAGCVKFDNKERPLRSDSIYGYNNPARLAVQEIQDDAVFEGRPIGCLVSIGTGLKGLRRSSKEDMQPQSKFVVATTRRWLPQKSTSALRTFDSLLRTPRRVQELVAQLARMASDTEITAEQLARDYDAHPNRYFRLSPFADLGDIDLADVTQGPAIEGIASEFVSKHEVQRKLQACAKQLLRVRYEPQDVLEDLLAPRVPRQAHRPLVKDSQRHSAPYNEPATLWTMFLDSLQNVHLLPETIRTRAVSPLGSILVGFASKIAPAWEGLKEEARPILVELLDFDDTDWSDFPSRRDLLQGTFAFIVMTLPWLGWIGIVDWLLCQPVDPLLPDASFQEAVYSRRYILSASLIQILGVCQGPLL